MNETDEYEVVLTGEELQFLLEALAKIQVGGTIEQARVFVRVGDACCCKLRDARNVQEPEEA